MYILPSDYTISFMKRILSFIVIIFITAFQLQPSFAKTTPDVRFGKIKGDYLITYIYNDKTPKSELYNHLVQSFSYSSNHYQNIYVDTVTPLYQPIQSYDVNPITKTSLIKELRYYLNLYNSSPDFGSYTPTADRSIFAIEGRFAGKSFVIKIPDYTNYYLDTDVNNEQLALRLKTIDRLGAMYNVDMAKNYTPKRFFALPAPTDVPPVDNYKSVTLKSTLAEKCQLLSSTDSAKLEYTGYYKVIGNGSTSNIYLYLLPYIPNLKIC